MIDPRSTGEGIARVQTPDGCIPWAPGRHVDPWNHVEAAMGLTVAGRTREAGRAFGWLASMQAEDGSWAAAYRDGVAWDQMVDANFCAYVATGVWHHFLATGNEHLATRMWPAVQRAIDFVLELQMPDGAIRWSRDSGYRAWPGALLTSSACIYLSVRCAVSLAEHVGEERPDWELALARLGDAVASGEGFESKDRYAMDWYYPVLAGVLDREEARIHLWERWDEFVIAGRGVRCVSDRPWVTSGETSELVLACTAAGLTEEASVLLDWMQHLRDSDGLYWTGANHPGGDLFPIEKTTWSAGAGLLAADAVADGPTAALLTGDGLVPRPAFHPARTHLAP